MIGHPQTGKLIGFQWKGGWKWTGNSPFTSAVMGNINVRVIWQMVPHETCSCSATYSLWEGDVTRCKPCTDEVMTRGFPGRVVSAGKAATAPLSQSKWDLLSAGYIITFSIQYCARPYICSAPVCVWPLQRRWQGMTNFMKKVENLKLIVKGEWMGLSCNTSHNPWTSVHSKKRAAMFS